MNLKTIVFVACGLNHKTAPLHVREKLALPVALQDTLLNHLMSVPAVNEAAMLSTCNRTEIYCDTDEPHQILSWLAEAHQIPQDTLANYFYTYCEEEGIRHVLRVASGLDSMMLGEPQILGQMKQAYQQACRVGAIKSNLQRVFQSIFSASKRIRQQSGIGNNPVSIAYAAVQLISRSFPNDNGLRVFLIGSGETATLVAKYLHQAGVKHFMVASRTQAHAARLAMAFNGEALTISAIPHNLAKADVIISATACPLPFINKQLVEQALIQREQAPMFFLDLAVPRDVEPDVGELDGVHLYNVDDLQTMIEQGMDERRLAAIQAEQLIESELDNYLRQHRSLQAKHVICDYRSQMQSLAQQELHRAMQQLSAGKSQDRVLIEFSERLINKFTHAPTLGLQRAASDNRDDLLELAKYLFYTPTETAPYETIT